MEKQLQEKTVYEGKVVRLSVDEVLLEDGNRSQREVVHHRGGCCIALKDPEDGKYFCVRQYRYAVGEDMLEFCAGKTEPGEEPAVTVQREAEEELGYRVENLRNLGVMIPTCGYSSERIYLFAGDKGEYVGTNFDEGENVQPEKYSLEELKAKVLSGELVDGKTLAILYRLSLTD